MAASGTGETAAPAADAVVPTGSLAGQEAPAPAEQAPPAGTASDPAGTTASAAGAAVSPVPDASTLLAQAREKLDSYRTFKATLVETVEFGPRRFTAEGVYMQGIDQRVRIDLEVSIGKNKGRLLQISDGDVLHTVYDVGATPRITRRDVKQILAAIKNEQATSTVKAELGLGGLPALLSAIEQSIEFQPTVTAAIDGRDFYILEGTWKPLFREQFERQAQQFSNPGPEGEPRPLPAHIPDFIRLYIDAESLVPYRVRYLKQSTAPGEEPAPLLTLDFRDIVVNASIDPIEFRYAAPEGVQVADITKLYLQQIQGPANTAPPTPPAQ